MFLPKEEQVPPGKVSSRAEGTRTDSPHRHVLLIQLALTDAALMTQDKHSRGRRKMIHAELTGGHPQTLKTAESSRSSRCGDGGGPYVGPDPLFSQRFSPTRQMRQSQTPGSFEYFAERQDFVTVLGLVQDMQGQGSLSTVVCRFGKRIQRGAYASVERAQDLELGGPGFRSRPCLSQRSLRKKKVLVMGIHFRDVLRIR